MLQMVAEVIKYKGNSSCYLSITPPDHAGSFVLNVYYHYQDGSSGKLAQLIQYGAVIANNGYYYQSNNNRVVTAIDQTQYCLFQLYWQKTILNLRLILILTAQLIAVAVAI